MGEDIIVTATPGVVNGIVTNVVGTKVYCGQALLPGTVTVTGSMSWTDQGDGRLKSGSNFALVNYNTGVIEFPLSGTWTVNAIIAAPSILVPITMSIPVTVATQRKTYVEHLDPPPLRGSVRVAVFIQEKWYVLRDYGAGLLIGAPNIGTGRLSAEDTLTVELGILPDLDSYVLITWQAATQYTIVTQTRSAMTPGDFSDGRLDRIVYDHPQIAVDPESVESIRRNIAVRYEWSTSNLLRFVDFKTQGATQGVAPFQVKFISLARNASEVTLWQWDFTADGIWDSTERDPTYTYTQPGTYTVKLRATYEPGVMDEEVKINLLVVLAQAPPPTALPRPLVPERSLPSIALLAGWSQTGVYSGLDPNDAVISIGKAVCMDDPVVVHTSQSRHIMGTLTLNRVVAQNTTYLLSSSEEEIVQVPASISVLMGTISTPFPITVMGITGTAQISGPFGSLFDIQVIDPPPDIQLQIGQLEGEDTYGGIYVYENAGIIIGRVLIYTPAEEDISITITSSNTDVARIPTVPASKIAAGSTELLFNVEIIGDGTCDITADPSGTLPSRIARLTVLSASGQMTPKIAMVEGRQGLSLVGEEEGGIRGNGDFVVLSRGDEPALMISSQQRDMVTDSATITASKSQGLPQYIFTIGGGHLPLYLPTLRLRFYLRVEYPYMGTRVQDITLYTDSEGNISVTPDDVNDPKIVALDKNGYRPISGTADAASGIIVLNIREEWDFEYYIPHSTTETIDGQGNIIRTTSGGVWDKMQPAIPEIPDTLVIAYSVEGT